MFFVISALILDLIVVGIVKGIVRRRRPAHNRMDMFATISVDNFSFPSGHTTRAAMVTFFIASQFPLSQSLVIAIYTWMVAVGFSRILLGRHHIIDVLCGTVIGILQYYLMEKYLWISSERTQQLLQPIHEEIHI